MADEAQERRRLDQWRLLAQMQERNRLYVEHASAAQVMLCEWMDRAERLFAMIEKEISDEETG